LSTTKQAAAKFAQTERPAKPAKSSRLLSPPYNALDMSPAVTDRPPARWALILAFALVYFCWGTTYLALKIGVQQEQWPPCLFGGVRVCIAGLLILACQVCRGQSIALVAGDRWIVVVCALLLFVGGNGLINVASQTLDSGVSAVLAATTPLWIAFFAMFWPHGDRLTPRGWLGLFIGLGGVLLVWMPRLQSPDGFTANVGVFAVLGSACSWAIGSLVGRHYRVRCSHLTAAGYQTLLGGGCLALVGFALGEQHDLPDHITAKTMAAFFWLLIFGSLIGFIAYNWLLAHVSVTQVGTYAYVNPAIAVVLGIADGEPATVWLFGGIVVVLVGVALVRGGLRKC